jgi:hypothetical protein
VNGHASINTQKPALNTIVFMYREFMRKPIECLNYSYAKPSKRVPTIFSENEAREIIQMAKTPIQNHVFYYVWIRNTYCRVLKSESFGR